jgi:hypothetical protein
MLTNQAFHDNLGGGQSHRSGDFGLHMNNPDHHQREGANMPSWSRRQQCAVAFAALVTALGLLTGCAKKPPPPYPTRSAPAKIDNACAAEEAGRALDTAYLVVDYVDGQYLPSGYHRDLSSKQIEDDTIQYDPDHSVPGKTIAWKYKPGVKIQPIAAFVGEAIPSTDPNVPSKSHQFSIRPPKLGTSYTSPPKYTLFNVTVCAKRT